MTEEMERLGTTAWERAIAGVHWRPDKHTGVAVVSYLLVVAVLFVAFQVFTTERVAANFITFGIVGLAGAGVAVPVFYTVFIRRRPLADLGLTTRFLVPSLILGLLLGWDTYRNTVATIDVAWTPAIVPLATMTLAVGLFEAVFFRGWRDSFLPVIAGFAHVATEAVCRWVEIASNLAPWTCQTSTLPAPLTWTVPRGSHT